MTSRPDRNLAVMGLAFGLCVVLGLAVLAGLATIERSGGWRTRLAGEMTVAIRASGAGASDSGVARAAEVLAGAPGVAEVRVIDRAKVAALLKPWTSGARTPDLAILPRLIAVDLDRKSPARRETLVEALQDVGIDAVVDDHQGWRRSAMDFQRRASLPLLATLVLCLAGLAATGSLAAEREIDRLRESLTTRLLLGESASACLRPILLRCAPGLGLGVLLGGLAAGGAALASGLAATGPDARTLAVPAGVLAAATAAGALAAAGGLVVAAARRIRDLEP